INLIKVCPPATIVGTVLNAVTLQPIADAIVGGGGVGTRTLADGTYRLEGVQVGFNNLPIPVQITASKFPDFQAQSKMVTVFCSAEISLDFGRPSTATGAIQGHVTNLDTAQPMAGVSIGSEFG